MGAWDYLKWGHIKSIERNGNAVAARVRVYAEEDEEYFTFITPEAYFEIKGWMDYRIECGEAVTEESWVMRNLWEVASPNYPAEFANRGLLLPAVCIASARLIIDLSNKAKKTKFRRILPFVVISILGAFGLVSTTALITLDVNSSSTYIHLLCSTW